MFVIFNREAVVRSIAFFQGDDFFYGAVVAEYPPILRQQTVTWSLDFINFARYLHRNSTDENIHSLARGKFMTELDRIKPLVERMIRLWAWCWDDTSGFMQQEAERVDVEKEWNRWVDNLKAQLLLYLEDGQPTLDDLIRDDSGRQLVWLAVLDKVLWELNWDLAGYREPFTVVTYNQAKWMVFLRQRPLGPTVHQSQSFHVRNYLQHHCIIPAEKGGRSIDVVMPGPSLQRSLRSLVGSQRSVKCYLGSFADGIQPDWNGMPNKRCQCSRLDNLAGRRTGLYQLLNEALTLEADVVVFPELSLCPELRQDVCRWLKNNSHPFRMVVPGSFHEQPDPHSGMPINRTRLLDGKGREALIHDKVIPLGTKKVCFEVIKPGKCLNLLKTPLGVVALAICRDFLEEDRSVSLPWQEIAPDWVFVPSMTPPQGIRSHEVQAGTLSNCCGTRSLVPNQCPFGTYAPTPPKNEENSHGFACWPDTQGVAQVKTIKPPSRLVSVPI